MDFNGITIGLYSYLLSLIISFFFLTKENLNRNKILNIVLICAGGHFIGGIFFYWFAINNHGDSYFYFNYASIYRKGLGANFVLRIFAYLKMYLFGGSLLGAFLFSSAIGFLGSIFYLLTFKVLLNKISRNEIYFLYQPNILIIPTLVILCWPSYFFWSAGLGKDSFSFLAIGLFLYVMATQKISIVSILLMLIAALLGFTVRPYLFLILGSSFAIFFIFLSKLKLFKKIILTSLIIIIAAKALVIIAKETQLSSYSLQVISQRAMENRSMTNHLGGTNFYTPPNINSLSMLLYLPYLMLCNLLLPLFIGSKNIMILISSFENAFLCYLIFSSFKNFTIYKILSKNIPILNFYTIYFLIGLGFLALINTNLGLAMREKMMYVPALIIVMMLIYSYRKILLLQQLLQKET